MDKMERQAEHGHLLEQIQWRSRRGVLELDVVMQRFLDAQLHQLSSSEAACLLEVLNYQDTELLALLVYRSTDPTAISDVAECNMVQRIIAAQGS